MSKYHEECKNCASKCDTVPPSIKAGGETFICPCLKCIVQMICIDYFTCPYYDAYLDLMYNKDSFRKGYELLMRGVEFKEKEI